MQFEQGPIRPPSEAGSLLIRFTRNCPWNKCTFCPVYKGTEFSRRSLEEVLGDIDAVRNVLDDLRAVSFGMGFAGTVTREVLRAVMTDPKRDHSYKYVANWAYHGKKNVFIQDANSFVLPADFLVEGIRHLRRRIPDVQRITSYGRSNTIARKTLEELKAIREAGLDRVHIGLESGSDKVLAFVKKGVKAEDHILAGRKVVDAGFELSEYYMPGLGGKALWEENADETARVLNAIDPHFIRIRSLRVPDRAPLHEDMAAGRFVPLSDDETVLEIRRFIQGIEGIRSRLDSEHIMNLLQDIAGVFPEDKGKMLAVIDEYFALPEEDKLLYRIGRRGGALNSVGQLGSPGIRQRLEEARRDLLRRFGDDIDGILREIADQYI